MQQLTNIMGLHDRNVGGRQAQAPGPAHIPEADADMSDPDAGGDEADSPAEAGEHESG